VGSTLGDLREAVSTLEDTDQIARRVFGASHPLVVDIEQSLRKSRAILSTRADAARAGTSIYSFSTPTPAADSAPVVDLGAAHARAETAHEENGADASATEDPNAELKAEIAQLEAQLTEKRRELSRRTGAPEVGGGASPATPDFDLNRSSSADARPPNASRFDSGDFSFHHSPSAPPLPPPETEGDEALARAIHDAELAVRAAHLDAAPRAMGSFSIGTPSAPTTAPTRRYRRIIRAG